MFQNLLKIRRGIRTCLRSLSASLHGPEKGKAKVRRILESFNPEQQKNLPMDPEDCARIYFRQKAFKRIKKAICMAEQSIEMQMFIWRADKTGREIAQLLVNAANRGVMVTVHKEVIGDVFEFADDFAATKDEKDKVWKEFWHHEKILILHKNQHDHSKTYIIDDELLLVTSMNIGDMYCNDWHECMVELRGSQFVEEYRNGNAKLSALTQKGHIQVLRSSSGEPMLPAVLELLASAKKSIRIEMAYFSDPKIMEILAKKTQEGIFVFLILPHSPDVHHNANLETVVRLLKLARKGNVFVFRYTRGLLHTKMIIIDRNTLYIGSTNLITSSLVKMGETNVLIHRRPRRCLRFARRRFAKDALQSIEVEAKELTRTSWQNLLSRFGL